MRSLRDIVGLAVSETMEGMEDRKTAVESICSFVEENYIDKRLLNLQRIEKMRMREFADLHRKTGVQLDCQDGRIMAVRILGDIKVY